MAAEEKRRIDKRQSAQKGVQSELQTMINNYRKQRSTSLAKDDSTIFNNAEFGTDHQKL
jgi:hypothetical protein